MPHAADIYRSLFKFGVFNAVQSQCFDTVNLLGLFLRAYRLIPSEMQVMHSNENMVRWHSFFVASCTEGVWTRSSAVRALQLIALSFAIALIVHPRSPNRKWQNSAF